LSEFFTGTAYAQTPKAPNGEKSSPFGSYGSLIPIVLMVVIFYFLLIRPQQKKEKDRKKMVTALQKGDKVLTVGGMIGIIDSIKENDIVVLKIGGNTKAEFTRNAIQTKVT